MFYGLLSESVSPRFASFSLAVSHRIIDFLQEDIHHRAVCYLEACCVTFCQGTVMVRCKSGVDTGLVKVSVMCVGATPNTPSPNTELQTDPPTGSACFRGTNAPLPTSWMT